MWLETLTKRKHMSNMSLIPQVKDGIYQSTKDRFFPTLKINYKGLKKTKDTTKNFLYAYKSFIGIIFDDYEILRSKNWGFEQIITESDLIDHLNKFGYIKTR